MRAQRGATSCPKAELVSDGTGLHTGSNSCPLPCVKSQSSNRCSAWPQCALQMCRRAHVEGTSEEHGPGTPELFVRVILVLFWRDFWRGFLSGWRLPLTLTCSRCLPVCPTSIVLSVITQDGEGGTSLTLWEFQIHLCVSGCHPVQLDCQYYLLPSEAGCLLLFCCNCSVFSGAKEKCNHLLNWHVCTSMQLW